MPPNPGMQATGLPPSAAKFQVNRFAMATAQARHQPPTYRVLIVDDVPAVRESLRWAFDRNSAHPPIVIFLTVHSDPLARQRGAEAGGDGFAEKGIGWSALIGQIRQALAQRASR